MKEMWNKRYAEDGYAYGDEPNVFFKQQIDQLSKPGKLLLPAEGEGRNAVYAAKRGWEVHAFDISQEGQKKAMQLANDNNVSINYQVGTLDELNFSNKAFDSIGLIYAHFPTPIRAALHAQFSNLIKPGGHLILEGFSKTNLPLRQANPQVGGPDKLDMLFSVEEIAAQFNEIKPIILHDEEVELNEGKYHMGTARVIRFMGQKQ